MTVGMPGSGISALFYLCLVLWMPVREAARGVRAGLDRARWKNVGFFWSLLGVILGALWLEAWLLGWAFGSLAKFEPVARSFGSVEPGQALFLRVGQFAGLGSLLTLGAVVLAGSLMRLLLRPDRPTGRVKAGADEGMAGQPVISA